MKVTGTVQEAVAASGLSKSTIYNLVNDGKLRTVTVGRRRLLSWPDLLGMLEAA